MEVFSTDSLPPLFKTIRLPVKTYPENQRNKFR
jgi:hypothetical protein